MSWDLFVMRLPEGAEAATDIEDGFSPDLIGPRVDVIAALRDVWPSADFSDPSWGLVDGPGFAIEVSIADDPVRSFALHVRGDRESLAVGFVTDVLERLGVQAFDPQSESGIFQPERATESWSRWRAYRGRTLGLDGNGMG